MLRSREKWRLGRGLKSLPVFLCLAVLLAFPGAVLADTIHVKAGAEAGGDGAGWDTAYNSLALALHDAIPGDEIWVAAGTYRPTEDGNRSANFMLKSGVALYGGFDGTETSRDQRESVANETVLTGDLNGDDVVAEDGSITGSEENSNNVVVAYRVDETAVLDGFTVTGGNARDYGGGMFNISATPTVTDCRFVANSAGMGGGMCNYQYAAPSVTGCTFSGNRAVVEGGGMANCTSHSSAPQARVAGCTFIGNSAGHNGGGMSNSSYASPVVEGCTFGGNSAALEGGGIYNYRSSNPTVANCTFIGNSADQSGGGMSNAASNPKVAYCTFSGNLAAGAEEKQGGGGMYNSVYAEPVVTDCIFWDEQGGEILNVIYSAPTLSHCVVRSGDVGEGAVSDNIFVGDPRLGFLADCGGQTKTVPLLTGSSAIDAGIEVTLPGVDLSTDQCGMPRPWGEVCDIGAYEVNRWYTVSVSCDAGGTVSAEPYGLIAESADFAAFDMPTFIVTPEESMDLTGLWFDGASLDFSAEGTSLKLEPLSRDHALTAAFAVKTFIVTGAVSGDHGTVTDSVTVDWGGVAETVVSADAHYHIEWVGVDGERLVLSDDLKSHTITFRPVTADHTVTVGFAIDRHLLTVNTGGTGTGTVTPDGGLYDWGTGVGLTAHPDASSNFTGWSGVLSGDVNPSTVVMDDDRSVTAIFDLKTFIVTTGAGSGGTVSPAGANSVTWGERLTVDITPDEGYAISDVVVDGESVGVLSSYEFRNVQSSHTLLARFKRLVVPVTADDMRDDPDQALTDALAAVADGGTITFPDDLADETFVLSQDLQIAQNVTLVAPEGGLTLAGDGTHRLIFVDAGADVTLSGFAICSGDVMGEEDRRGGGILNAGTLTLCGCSLSGNRAETGGAVFNGGNLTLLNCTFHGNSGLWGSAVTNGGGAALRLSHCTVSGNSDVALFNHAGADLELKGSLVAGNGNYDITGFPEDCRSGGHNLVGVVPRLADVFLVEGDRVISDITAEELFLDGFGIHGGGTTTLALRTGSPALDTGVSTDISDSVVPADQRGVARPQGAACDIGAYEAEWFTVTVSADLGGTVSAEPYGVISASADFTERDRPAFVITPDEGMAVAEVLVDGTAYPIRPEGGVVMFDPLSVDHTLEAVFSTGVFSINATAGPGGSVDPTTASVPFGQDHTVTVTPEAGYVVADVTADGQSVGAVSSHTFRDVRENHTLTARFVPDPDAGGVEDLDVTDGGSALIVITEGTSGLDLPDGASFDRVGSSDVTGSAEMRGVDSDDVRDALSGVEPEGTFLTGSSFDVAAEAALNLEGTGVLPLDVTLEVPRAKLTPACLEAIERSGAEAGLKGAFLGEVEIFKVTEGKAYDLFDVVLGGRHDPEDFFAVSRDEAGDFHVGLRLLIADAPSEGVSAVQAVVASGDCRFLVFDGNRDGHFVDPLVAVEKPHGSGGGGGGCSVGLALPGMALLLLPLMALMGRR